MKLHRASGATGCVARGAGAMRTTFPRPAGSIFAYVAAAFATKSASALLRRERRAESRVFAASVPTTSCARATSRATRKARIRRSAFPPGSRLRFLPPRPCLLLIRAALLLRFASFLRDLLVPYAARAFEHP